MKKSDIKNQIFTLPNLLSFVRLGLIPFMAWIYCVEKEYLCAGILLILSGITDIVDGYIARRFNMISDLGKVLDPIADKLTQVVMLLCLLFRFPLMLLPIIFMVLKEIFMTISGCMVIKKCDKVLGANWHGKTATICIFAMILLHILWVNIPKLVSTSAILVCSGMIALSFILYAIRNITELLRK